MCEFCVIVLQRADTCFSINSLWALLVGSLIEIARLRHLALWGRQEPYKGLPINPLIVLTSTELFARHNISDAWKKIDDKEIDPVIDLNDLHTLAQMTQQRYLALQPYYRRKETSVPEPMRRLLSAIQSLARETG